MRLATRTHSSKLKQMPSSEGSSPDNSKTGSRLIARWLISIGICTALSACVTSGGEDDTDTDDSSCDAFGQHTDGSDLYAGAIAPDALQRSGIDFNDRTLGNLTLTVLGEQPITLTTSEPVVANKTDTQRAITELMEQYALFGYASHTEVVNSNTYSADQLNALAGISASLLDELLGADNSQNNSGVRYSVINTVQPYYEVSAAITDTESDAINSVRYGNSLKLIARSSHDDDEVTAALLGAISGGHPDVVEASGYTHEAILEMVDVYLIDANANPAENWQRLDISPQVLAFNAITTQLSDPMLNTFSAQNPGAPIDFVVASRTKDNLDQNPDSTKTTLSRCTPPPTPTPTPTRYYLEVENVKAGEVTVTINGTQCGTKSKTSRQYDIYRCLRENSPNDIRVSFNTDFGCRQTSISWYIHKNRDYNPIWPNRSSAQINSVKCDDFYWTSTLNTATDTFGNYRYVD